MEQKLKTPELTRDEYIYTFWKTGFLKYKLHSGQKEMYDIFYGSPRRSILVWLISRQFGKSYTLAILALEQAIKKEDSIVKLVTDTKIHVKSIFEKIFKEILSDCPEEFKPKYVNSDYTFYFPNGSQIQMAGSDGKNYERIRGQKAALILIDEAAFCDHLDNMIWSTFYPTTTHTGGKVVLATTPPVDSDHEFLNFMEKAEIDGFLTKKTIYDNPIIPEEEKRNIEHSMGGKSSIRFRREYLVEIIRDSSRTVIPEFTQEAEQEIVKKHPVPPFKDCYVGMDLGGKDFTALIFGYYDFRADKVVIQDELVLDFSQKDVNLQKLVTETRKIEDALWTNVMTNEFIPPYKRVSDVDYIALKEIHQLSHGTLNFTVSKKDDKVSAINQLRLLIQNQKLVIDPKCVNLIRHLKNVKWKSESNKEVFARSADNGHYDCVDALIYLIRSIDFSRNPYPAGYSLNMRDNTYYVGGKDKYLANNSGNKQLSIYKKIFGK